MLSYVDKQIHKPINNMVTANQNRNPLQRRPVYPSSDVRIQLKSECIQCKNFTDEEIMDMILIFYPDQSSITKKGIDRATKEIANKLQINTNRKVVKEDMEIISRKLSERIDNGENDGKHYQQYLNLMGHIAGDVDQSSGNVSGGHLEKGIKAKWGERNVKIYYKSNEDEDGVFQGTWSVTIGKKTYIRTKTASFFPKDWTMRDLERELKGSHSRQGGRASLELKSGILVKKEGDTFYPLTEE